MSELWKKEEKKEGNNASLFLRDLVIVIPAYLFSIYGRNRRFELGLIGYIFRYLSNATSSVDIGFPAIGITGFAVVKAHGLYAEQLRKLTDIRRYVLFYLYPCTECMV